MAGKEFTVYSTNPKMDTSGVSAKQPRIGYEMRPLPAKQIAGGTLYLEAIDEGIKTNKAGLKKIASLVNTGISVDHAVDIVAREEIEPNDIGCC